MVDRHRVMSGPMLPASFSVGMMIERSSWALLSELLTGRTRAHQYIGSLSLRAARLARASGCAGFSRRASRNCSIASAVRPRCGERHAKVVAHVGRRRVRGKSHGLAVRGDAFVEPAESLRARPRGPREPRPSPGAP